LLLWETSKDLPFVEDKEGSITFGTDTEFTVSIATWRAVGLI